MKKFISKILIFTFPFYAAMIFYFISDPFKVLYKYENYIEDGKPMGVQLDKDFVSVESYLKNHKKYNYDSFIFGNSRSIFYPVSEWQKYIGQNASCFHFDASAESLYGIYKKVMFLNDSSVKCKNVLIVLDAGLLNKVENSEGHVGIKHYKLSGQSWLSFQWAFFADYISTPKFVVAYLDYKTTGKIKPYMMDSRMLSGNLTKYDSKFNEISFPNLEDSINNYPDIYYASKKSIFFKRPGQLVYAKPVIKEEQLKMLKEIQSSFEKNGTHVKVVINPLYDQRKISIEDLAILKQLFGGQNVNDYSGINEFTSDKRNYYENSHYRPKVASKIMEEVYKN